MFNLHLLNLTYAPLSIHNMCTSKCCDTALVCITTPADQSREPHALEGVALTSVKPSFLYSLGKVFLLLAVEPSKGLSHFKGIITLACSTSLSCTSVFIIKTSCPIQCVTQFSNQYSTNLRLGVICEGMIFCLCLSWCVFGGFPFWLILVVPTP